MVNKKIDIFITPLLVLWLHATASFGFTAQFSSNEQTVLPQNFNHFGNKNFHFNQAQVLDRGAIIDSLKLEEQAFKQMFPVYPNFLARSCENVVFSHEIYRFMLKAMITPHENK